MLGGKDEPCIPTAHLERFAKMHGRPCPRVELEPENVGVAPIAMLALQPERWGWALPSLLADTQFQGPRRYAVWRVISCIGDEAVTGRIEAKREAAMNEARRK